MKVLVAGGNGFLGAHVVRQLIENKNEVISFDINPISKYNAGIKHKIAFVKGDITDASSVLDAIQHYRINRVVHLASMVTLATQNNPDMAYRLNVGGLLNTLEAVRLANVGRLIYASSLAVYGSTDDNIPVSENQALNPVSLYGATKVFGEELCKAYHKNYSMDYAAIRFPAMWGPGQGQLGGKSAVTGSGKFADIIEMPARGKIPTIRGASQKYDLLYVKDAAGLIVSALTAEKLGHQAYNAGTGHLVSMSEIGDSIMKWIPGADFHFEEGYDYFSVPCKGPMDITRARQNLGYKPVYHLHEAVEDYLQYLKDIGAWKETIAQI